MSHMTMVTIEVPEKLYQDLQARAEERHSTVPKVIQDLLELQVDEEFEEDTDEEIVAGIRQAIADINAGRTISVDEFRQHLGA